MKITYLFISLLFISVSTQAGMIQHLDPEMTGEEYRILLNSLEKKEGFVSKISKKDPLKVILNQGARNLDWIAAINAKRDAQHKLELTTPETTRGYPIDAPGFSNRTIILKRLADLKAVMPQEMAKVIFGTVPIPHDNPIDDKTFLDYARQMNHVYESASRWLLQEPYLLWYSMYAKNDIRGYYFLSKEKELNKKLNEWDSLDETTQTKYAEWLAGECFNSRDLDDCQKELKKDIKAGKVLKYHKKYVDASKKTYDAFFTLQNPRKEASWTYKEPDTMYLPFKQPDRKEVELWFKTNVEDEWHINQWALRIVFKQTGKLAKVVFEPNVTPHVNGLGGDTITMDANRPLNEYSVTWTIRHEFGHVLGFPDCYQEFYDDEKEVMINYQLDLTNLMCSRRGHLQTQHYTALKDNYYKAQKH